MLDQGKTMQRKTLFTQRVPGGPRMYDINVEQWEDSGKKYLTMSESKQVDGTWKRHSVFILPDYVAEWKKAFEEALLYLD